MSSSTTYLRAIVVACSLLPFCVSGQSNPFLPADTTVLFGRLESIAEASIARLPDGTHPAVADIYHERSADLIDEIRDSSYFFVEDFQYFVEGIFDDLIEGNGLSVEPLVLISRSPSINASSLGDGLFVINMGLLNRLSSADELAFVIGHELAHDQLAHLADKLDYLAERRAAEPTDRKSRREYRRRLKREGKENIMLGLRDKAYAQSRHSRTNELAADSLGAQYLANSPYQPTAAAYSLEKLREYDAFLLPTGTAAALLTTETYPFKEKWTAPPPTLFGGSFGSTEEDAAAKFWQKDSLASHPDLEERITLATRRVAPFPQDIAPARPAQHLFVEPSRREIVRAYLDHGLTAHALALSLAALTEDRNQPFYLAAVGEALLGTYRSIQQHAFDRRIPPTAYFENDGAREMLRFLHQIRNSELRRLTLAYLDEHTTSSPDNARIAELSEEAIHYFNTIDE